MEVPRPAVLTIEEYGTPPSLIFRFLDDDGHEMTHDHPYDLDQAFADAEREFAIPKADWTAENSN